jgi:16S rRNA (guanine527-N7)-methyltransferase
VASGANVRTECGFKGFISWLPGGSQEPEFALKEVVRQIEGAFGAAGLTGFPAATYEQFGAYLELLRRWNERINLTAICEPGELIQRHFVECAFAGQQLPSGIQTLLDYGSGAGFPGIPFAIVRPEICVTLAEALSKKAAFLREVLRVLGIAGEVFNGRVESMALGRQFDAVSMRAVEKMELSIPIAAGRASQYLVLFTTENSSPEFRRCAPGFGWTQDVGLPHAEQRILSIGHKL